MDEKKLPQDFIQRTKTLFGEDLFADFIKALAEPATVSIRLNPYKKTHIHSLVEERCERVPWCRNGYYLKGRPNFTFDPLFHAGCYYVQEPSSMFVGQVLRQYVKDNVQMLDLCAAPGGKSTCVRSFLSPKSLLICNEPIRKRASILNENIEKLGAPNTFVTNLYPKDLAQRLGEKSVFDVILADVPCSGEGMFRKDEGAIAEWSAENVAHCTHLQRDIVRDIWPCLRPGGILIYSTCTYNAQENEENVAWICSELGAEVLPVEYEKEWGIVGALLDGFDAPVMRFIPGRMRGEGLFMAVLRKDGDRKSQTIDFHKLSVMERKNEPMSVDFDSASLPIVDVDYWQALHYLRREAIALPKDTPRGMVLISFQGQKLGYVKNVGNRANNLYPKEWAIRTTHLPSEKFSLL